MTTTNEKCAECAWGWSGAHPNYDHIHKVSPLPKARHSESRIIRRGWAVGMSGVGCGLPQTWVFFKDLEPAVVFGRAGRMSSFDIASYGVYEAAYEVHYSDQHRRDLRSLYIDLSATAHDHEKEQPILQRWVAGCDPKSAHFHQPAKKTR